MVDSSLFSQEDDHQPMEGVHQPYSQSILGNEFMFQQTLAVHQGAVRCLGTLDSGYLLSGSIDKTTKQFSLNNKSGRYDFDKELNYHNAFVYAIAPSIEQDGFFTGGKDNKIFKMDLLGNPMMVYEEHEMPVNSLSQCIKEEFVSGSWDGTAKIWDVQTGKVKQTLKGHSYAVSVLTLLNGITITGSQDKKLRLWYNGMQQKEIDAHGDIIRDIKEVPGIGFATCSNDELVKLWTIDGTQLAEFKGHHGFVFSLCVLDSGEIISGSDDCTVKVWRDGQCAQTINHPRTVWSVNKNHLGDIITGSEDYKIRTFTRDHVRKDDSGQDFKDYEAELKAAQLGSNLDLKTLPDVSVLSHLKGKKDGEVKVFRNGSSGEAYVWKEDSQSWDKIGDVITNPDTAPGQVGAKFYEGDKMFDEGEYDHIFDVDLGDGFNRKIPFDNGGNPYEAADKFVAREQLGRAYTEQIVAFLKQNAQSFATSDNADKRKALKGSLSGGSGAVGGAKGAGKNVHIPMRKMLFFDAINVDGPKKKLIEFNNESNVYNEKELQTLDSLLELIKNKPLYHSSKVSKQGFEVIRKFFRFHSDKSFPALDIYRQFLMHPHSTENFNVYETGQEYTQMLIGFLRDEKSGQATQLMALRCLVNLFFNSASLYMVLSKRQFLLDNAVQFVMSDNKNLRNAAITLILNYSIQFLDKNDPEGRIQCVSALSEVFGIEKDAGSYMRAIAAIGNLSYQDQDAGDLVRGIGIKIDTSKLEGGDEKTINTIKEIAKEIGLN